MQLYADDWAVTGDALLIGVFGAELSFVEDVLESTCEGRDSRLCTPTAFWEKIEFKVTK